LDEVDKMSMDFRGDPSSALLEVLDPEQNAAFQDHYLDLDYDLSNVMFITTANTLPAIPLPLQDRMEIIRLPGYTEPEKIAIAHKYLVHKQCEANGLVEKNIKFTESALKFIVRRYTREAGVRNLEREIASVSRKVAREVATSDNRELHITVTPKRVQEYLGVPKFRFGLVEAHDEVGLCTGLAWTEVGGELLQSEVQVLPGKGKLTITGKLGEVMQESAQAAMTYVRSRAEALGLDKQFYQRVDIHVHLPEGAIPKDGPSAGITMATAIVSALLKIPCRKDVAMTGEITLRGRILPIGGLKEKLLAAHRGMVKRVIIPKENEKDLKEIPAKVLKELTIVRVEHMDEVLRAALAVEDPERLFKKRGNNRPIVPPPGDKTPGPEAVVQH
ncbi:MAG: endopeptidase La, partial [Deltaproteobacteria bacterium]|nr:endopeptidase La [Deltaproteobacteria bacterium]